MDEVIIQKRLSNWADHLLKRLQVLYDRGDFCDLILQFHTNQILKVHRVVVNLCTEYFANLERTYGLQNGMLVLPKDIEYSSVVTIVKFFYTGKLEVKGSQFNDTYRTVKLMNILILTKLLEAHARNPITTAKKEPAKPIIFKQAVELGKSSFQKIPGGNIIQEGSTINLSSNMTTKNITTRPMKTKTVLARVQSQPSVVRVATNHHQGKLLTNQQKKLPIWKERKFAPQSLSDPLMLEKWPPRDEPPRPTRFEWPDDTDDADPYLTPATHKLMEKQKANSTHQPQRKAEDIFDAVKSQNQGIKRSMSTASSTITSSDSSIQMELDDSPASKVAKMSDQSTTSEESMIVVSMSSNDLTDSSMSDVNLTEETIEEEVSTSEGFSQDMSSTTTTIMSGDVASSSSPSAMYSEEESCSSEISISSTPSSSKHSDTISIIMSPPTSSSTFNKRSSIKTGFGGMTSSSTAATEFKKTVRFAPEVEKENNTNKSTIQVSSSSSNVMIPKNVESSSASNHSKIISEVLKKYPDLVKDHKNIKLKIVHKESQIQSSTSGSPSKDPKSKVSYIVLKSTSSPDSAGSLVLKKPFMNKAFWESDRTRKLPSGAENTSGPWMCGTSPCTTEDNPIQFDTYYSYRRHLVDVHKERIDARICEYCGHKASKRNLLLYHLYTKHGINPPMNCSFPHCEKCDYVALSESLLIKHKQGHDANKEFSCTICNASFKSSGALQGHMVANLHRNKDTKVYECPYCRKPFVRNINLKAHIRSLHKDVARSEEMEDPRLLPDETMMTSRTVTLVGQPGGVKKRQIPSILGGTRTIIGNTLTEHSEDMGQHMEGLVRSLVTADGQTIEILHHGIDPMSVPVQLVPSSEAEALTNVATSIAASLGLDHGQVGTEFVTGVNSDGSPAVFIMDNSQNAVEVDVSGVNVGMADHGSMIFEGGDPTGGSEQFIVQDMQGNHFRKIEAVDETGKQVIFFQLQSENGQVTMAPGIQLDDSIARFDDGQGEGGAHFNFESGQAHFPNECSVFVNTTSLPVTVSSDGVMSLANAGGSRSVIELVSAAPGDGQHNTVVTTESLMGQVQHCSVVSSDHQHLIQTSQGQVTVDHMGQLQVIQEAMQDVQVQVGQLLHANNNKSESGEIIIEQIDDMSHQQQEQHQQHEQQEEEDRIQNQQQHNEGQLEIHSQHQEQQQQQEGNENQEQVDDEQHEKVQHYQNESYNIQQEEVQVIQKDSCTHETHILEGGSDQIILKPEEETQIIQSETTEIPTTPNEHERESHILHENEEPQNETQILNQTEIVQNVDDQVIHETDEEKSGEVEIIHHQVIEQESIEMEVQKTDKEQEEQIQVNKEDQEQIEEIEQINENNVSDESQMIVEGQDTGNERVLLEESMQVDEVTTENIEMQIEKETVVDENTIEYVQSEIIQETPDERTEMENEEREVQQLNPHEHIEEVQHNGTISSDSDHISSLVLEQVKEQENGAVEVDSVNNDDNDTGTKSGGENDNFQQSSEQNVSTVENSESVLYAQVELVCDQQQQQEPSQQQRQETVGDEEEEEESIERIEAEVQRDLNVNNNQIPTEADTHELMVCVEDATVDV